MSTGRSDRPRDVAGCGRRRERPVPDVSERAVSKPPAAPSVVTGEAANDQQGPAGDEARKRAGLRTLLLRGSAYEMIGYGSSQVIRFGSNLLLSRLLFPEAFGLAALVNIMNQGLIMLSDVGLPTVIVQSSRGDDPRFLNTAFTWQAARAVGMWLVALGCAVPMALFYKEPQLRILIPFGALSILILGLRSTGYYTMRRRLTVAPLMFIELASQAAAVAIMVPWAKVHPSVWALVAGTVTSSVAAVVGSHMLRVGYRNRFAWDRDSAKSMFDFGKWVAGSSVLTFASQQGDRLLLGRYLGAGTLGVYSIAVFLSGALGEAITRITHGVFFPAYSRVREDGIPRLQQVFYSTRLAVDAVIVPALGGLAALGPFVVDLLYDKRYVNAGWMLRVLSVRVAIAALTAPAQFLLFAIGESRWGFFLNLARTIALVIGVPIGFYVDRVAGLVWAVAFSELPALLVVYFGLTRAKLVSWRHELRVPLFYALGLGLGYACTLLLHQFGLH
jgi:O-antigen/teichoic acid export membrane protein